MSCHSTDLDLWEYLYLLSAMCDEYRTERWAGMWRTEQYTRTDGETDRPTDRWTRLRVDSTRRSGTAARRYAHNAVALPYCNYYCVCNVRWTSGHAGKHPVISLLAVHSTDWHVTNRYELSTSHFTIRPTCFDSKYTSKLEVVMF